MTMTPLSNCIYLTLIVINLIAILFGEPLQVIDGCLGPFFPPPIGTKFTYRLLEDYKNGHAKHDVSIGIMPIPETILTRSWVVDICFVEPQCITAVWNHDVELIRVTNVCWRIYSNPSVHPLVTGDTLDFTFLTYRSNSNVPSIPAFLVMLGNQVKVELRPNVSPKEPKEFCADCDSGYSAIEGNCTKYVRCNHGQPITRNCPHGTSFNPRKNICDWPESAGCGNTPALIRRTCTSGTCVDPYIHFAFISACVESRIGLFG